MDLSKLKEAIAKVVTDGYDARNAISDIRRDSLTPDELRTMVQEIESAIKGIAGKQEEWGNRTWSTAEMDALSKLDSERGYALDLMVRPTPAEVRRLEHQNNVLLRRSLDLFDSHNTFRDHFKYDEEPDGKYLRAELYFDGCKSGEWHHMEEDDYYGSDFGYMLNLQAELVRRENAYRDIGGIIASELMDNGRDWSEGRFLVRPEYAHICFCFALNSLCMDISASYCIPDVLRMEGFTSCVQMEITEYLEMGE